MPQQTGQEVRVATTHRMRGVARANVPIRLARFIAKLSGGITNTVIINEAQIFEWLLTRDRQEPACTDFAIARRLDDVLVDFAWALADEEVVSVPQRVWVLRAVLRGTCRYIVRYEAVKGCCRHLRCGGGPPGGLPRDRFAEGGIVESAQAY